MLQNGTGKTNYTGVLSKDHLRKAYNEWLLPLRTLVSGIVAETATYSFNPIELVLYRCIELVEENLKHSA